MTTFDTFACLNFQKLTGERHKEKLHTPQVQPFLSCVPANELEPVASWNF